MSLSAPVRARVLVVDDSKTIRVQLQQMLRGEFECELAADGNSALEAAQARPPDLIISDVVMAPVDGYELCRRIRALPELRDVPVVLLTSSEDPDGKAIGIEQGADDYLAKPVRERELLARVRGLLRLRDAQRSLSAANEQLVKTQQELIQAEKLATLGTLAAGVAHEVNNPLSFVMSGVKHLVDSMEELAAGSLPEPQRGELVEDAREIRTDVLRGLERIRGIVEELGRFATHPEKGPVPLDVKSEIEAAVVALRPRIGRLQLSLELQHSASVVMPAGYVAQIVQNLLSNAADAVAGKPVPSVTIRSRDADRGVEVSVEDNGAGMSAATKLRLFEPFFTTKPAGKGAGLGLSVSQGILQRLGGSLSYDSEEGQGSRFRATFPLRARDAATAFNRSGGKAVR